MRGAREFSRSAFAKNARNARAAGLSLIVVRCMRNRRAACANNGAREKHAGADSESQILATKKFLCLTPPEGPLGASKPSSEPNRGSSIRIGASPPAVAASASEAIRRRKAALDCARRRGLRRRRAAFGASLDAELGLQQRVDGFRIGLAAGRLHHLADEPLDRRGLGLGLLHL